MAHAKARGPNEGTARYVKPSECILLLRQYNKFLQKISAKQKRTRTMIFCSVKNLCVKLAVQDVKAVFASQIWVTSSLRSRLTPS